MDNGNPDFSRETEQASGIPQQERRAGSPGEIAYNAYRESTGGKSAISGASLPDFSNTNEQVQAGWEAAAAAVVRAYELDGAGRRSSYGGDDKLAAAHKYDPVGHPVGDSALSQTRQAE